jgi:predicted TIM-barrel fold metal-dependent hydrolase
MKSVIGVRVVDAHAHFMTYNTVKSWLSRGTSLDRLEQRAKKLTDMTQFEVPHEKWDTAKLWVDEMNRYGVSAIGFMVDEEGWDEFNQARKRFPGYFMGYANIDPSNPEASQLVENAEKYGFQGIKLYPSSWPKHRASDEICYSIYDAAQKHKMLVVCHFGITIGANANLGNGNPLDIQVPSQEYPDLNFMIAHFGAGFFREVLMLQYQTDNVYMDTSGSNSWIRYQPLDLNIGKLFEKAITASGTDRIVFGTDSSFFPRGYRMNILEEQYHAVKALCSQTSLCLSDEQVNQIFSENILQLTGFKPRSH